MAEPCFGVKDCLGAAGDESGVVDQRCPGYDLAEVILDVSFDDVGSCEQGGCRCSGNGPG